MQNFTILEPFDVVSMIATMVNPLEDRIVALETEVAALKNPVPTSPSGKPIPTTVPAGWKVAVREDFDFACREGEFTSTYAETGIGFYPGPGEVSDANYGVASGGTGGYKDTSGRGIYTGKFISVADGVCKQRGFTDESGKIWVSALVPFANIGGTAKWGDVPAFIFEQCTRFPVMDTGFKMAHLAWPVSNNNNPDGELDWPEAENTRVRGYIHHQNPTVNGVQTIVTPSPEIDMTQWHIWRTEWAKGQYVRFYCDDVMYASLTGAKVPNNLMHIVLQNETSLLRNPTTKVLIPVPTTSKYEVQTDWVNYLIPA